MARGTMHAPKPDGERRRRNAPTHGDTVVEADNTLRGPDLAEATGRNDWHPLTLRWYDTWRRSPQAQLFLETDWSRLLMLAPYVESCNTALKPSAATLSEIRMNEERLGATVVDRMRARIRVTAPDDDDAPDAEVVPIHAVRDSVRARLQPAPEPEPADDDDDPAPF